MMSEVWFIILRPKCSYYFYPGLAIDKGFLHNLLSEKCHRANSSAIFNTSVSHKHGEVPFNMFIRMLK